MSKKKPPFGVVQFHLCKHFDIDPKEYLYLDQISNMQAGKRGKCNAPNDYFADLLNMSTRGIQKMNNRLIEKGLLTKYKGTEKRATDKFVSAKNGQVEDEQSAHDHEQSSHQARTKFTPSNEQSSPNKELDKEVDKEHINGYTDEYENIWKAYGRVGNKMQGYRACKKLSKADTAALVASIPKYLKHLRETNSLAYQRHLATYVNNRCWETDWEAETRRKQPKQASATTLSVNIRNLKSY